MSDFGEQVDLTANLASILRRYPFGIGLFREIIQNSDDAKASKQASIAVSPKGLYFVLTRRFLLVTDLRLGPPPAPPFCTHPASFVGSTRTGSLSLQRHHIFRS